MRLLPYTPERDAYRLLGVPPSASIDEIGMACRRLARTFHPDHNQSPRATQEMQVVNAVRRVLSDPEWRATYDRERWRFHAERLSVRAPGGPARRPRAAPPAGERPTVTDGSLRASVRDRHPRGRRCHVAGALSSAAAP